MEHGGQDGRDGGLGPVLEATLLMAGSGAGPCLGGAGRGPGQGQRPPAVAGQVAVGEAQDDGFFGAQRAVVQAAEERRQSGTDPDHGGVPLQNSPQVP